jgi:CheY-like chemotaxis protein
MLTGQKRDRPRILIVEDRGAVADMLAAFLAGNGFCHPLVALGVQDAKEIFSQERPDVVLLDLIMPPAHEWASTRAAGGFLSGIALHEDLVEVCGTHGWPVPGFIVLSGITAGHSQLSRQAREYCDKHGVMWLDKPASPDEVLSAITRLLRD